MYIKPARYEHGECDFAIERTTNVRDVETRAACPVAKTWAILETHWQVLVWESKPMTSRLPSECSANEAKEAGGNNRRRPLKRKARRRRRRHSSSGSGSSRRRRRSSSSSSTGSSILTQ